MGKKGSTRIASPRKITKEVLKKKIFKKTEKNDSLVGTMIVDSVFKKELFKTIYNKRRVN